MIRFCGSVKSSVSSTCAFSGGWPSGVRGAISLQNAWLLAKVLDNGLVSLPTDAPGPVGHDWCLVEAGVASRDDARSGIAHLSSNALQGHRHAQRRGHPKAIDSIGGQLDASPRRLCELLIKVLDEQLDRSRSICVGHRARRRSPSMKSTGEEGDPREIRWSRIRPTNRVHELFTQHSGKAPLGRPILGTKRRSRITTESLRSYFQGAYAAPNMIVSAAGNPIRRAARSDRQGVPVAACAGRAADRSAADRGAKGDYAHQGAGAEPRLPGTNSYPQKHDDRTSATS